MTWKNPPEIEDDWRPNEISPNLGRKSHLLGLATENVLRRTPNGNSYSTEIGFGLATATYRAPKLKIHREGQINSLNITMRRLHAHLIQPNLGVSIANARSRSN